MNERTLIGLALPIKLGWDFFFDNSSSDESDDDAIKYPKNMGYFEKSICLLNGIQFKAHFHMLPGTFELLYGSISYNANKYNEVARGHQRVSLEKQILITLWYLANTECLRSVADRFSISTDACWNAVFEISKQILKINHIEKIIAWPSAGKALETANYFLSKTKFPGIIGCIDASHIPIPAPRDYASSYINRKNIHSILLQGVCDQNMKFIDCYAGEVGSIHDSCMFRRSNLFAKISNGSLIIPEEQHMVGDLGYGLKTYLLTPYRDMGHLTREQAAYNKAHSAARVTIERAFGLLKCRFRRLNGLNTRRPDLIPLIIMTACILHNICIQNGDNLEIDPINDTDDGSNDPAVVNHERNPSNKRNEILRIINIVSR